MRTRAGDAPILLLDDVLSELDARARRGVSGCAGFVRAGLSHDDRVAARIRTGNDGLLRARGARGTTGMLTRIDDALVTWAPRTGGGDPLTIVRAAWSRLVGSDVARAACRSRWPTIRSWSRRVRVPGAINSRSSNRKSSAASASWSRPGRSCGYVFASVRSATKPGGRAAAARSPARKNDAAADAAAPLDAQEAFARFRAAVMRSRSAHAARGGTLLRGLRRRRSRRRRALRALRGLGPRRT